MIPCWVPGCKESERQGASWGGCEAFTVLACVACAALACAQQVENGNLGSGMPTIPPHTTRSPHMIPTHSRSALSTEPQVTVQATATLVRATCAEVLLWLEVVSVVSVGGSESHSQCVTRTMPERQVGWHWATVSCRTRSEPMAGADGRCRWQVQVAGAGGR